jgi:hypothetical protein
MGSKEVTEQEGQGPEMAMLQAAASTQIFARLLEEYYAPLELWHLKSSIEKVIPAFSVLQCTQDCRLIDYPPSTEIVPQLLRRLRMMSSSFFKALFPDYSQPRP